MACRTNPVQDEAIYKQTALIVRACTEIFHRFEGEAATVCLIASLIACRAACLLICLFTDLLAYQATSLLAFS